ncbi:dipeptide/oligopeptide/nickel ABC transporter permease/ATP-binding protein [Pseudonocardia sp. MH-G8]|uniref:dipeptide/oligopeptide/nickel ABC transporter permease/ATP-binding protein n=1 Tax=Pseudonocardia sp. MH-G8 TaxID=1854588 RepID=UPI001E55F878|nr:dipeptide/oligopeptide/nickel ABC transporter permease/ATP-binding protein [Pseudonocardia sp. MH-G8]
MGSRWSGLLRTPLGASAGAAVLALVVLAIIGPAVWGGAAEAIDVDALRDGPSAEHLVGTDGLGRDVLARVLVATRTSLGLALLATAIGVLSGVVLGALPAVLGRRAGRLVVAAVNLAVAFPALLLAIFLAVVFGVGSQGAVLAIGFAIAPPFARLTQTLAASVAGQDYVAAARALGVGRTRLLVRHVLPNIAEPLVVNAALGAGNALLAFAGLSFLGLGVQQPSYDWGSLLGEGLNRIYLNPAAALAPGAAVVLAGLAFTLLGEAAAAAIGLRATASHGRLPRLPALPPAAPPDPSGSVLQVRDLRVAFPRSGAWTVPVSGVSFDVREGEAVGIVGESGSGKSLTALAAAGLLPQGAVRTATALTVAGQEIRDVPDRTLRRVLGTDLAMVFQDPLTSLNPALRIGRQLAEVAEEHLGSSRRAAHERAVERLADVAIPDPRRRARRYPHEFSGGMRQRVMLGMALMAGPRLIIADEPTTALDVTVQQQVLRLLQRAREEHGTALLLISHDLAVVASVCDRVLVMYGGRIVEELPVSTLVAGPAHPYSRALLASVPQMDADRALPLATITGRPPDPGSRPPGCPFQPRCAHATDRCADEVPPLEPHAAGHRVACLHPQVGPVGPAASPSLEATS